MAGQGCPRARTITAFVESLWHPLATQLQTSLVGPAVPLVPLLGQKGAGCREVLGCPANLDVLAQDSEGTEQGAGSFEMLGPASYCQPALL